MQPMFPKSDRLLDSRLRGNDENSTTCLQNKFTLLLNQSGFYKRSGVAVGSVLYCLTMWIWLRAHFVSLFARDSLRTFCDAGKDVLYEALNREDWNWRALHLRVASKTLQQLTTSDSIRAFVLDDTIKIRSGKKMPGISSHFDHTTGHHVMGQQILTLGLATTEAELMIDHILNLNP